ncbi:MAG: hypothetical protein WDM96_03540 [Lacunisphaera sp.]
MTKLINDLGLARERIVVNPVARHRFIVRHGRLVPVPRSPPGFLVSPLFSLRARFKVVRELLFRPRVRTTDISLASLVAAHFGQEIVDYGAESARRRHLRGRPGQAFRALRLSQSLANRTPLRFAACAVSARRPRSARRAARRRAWCRLFPLHAACTPCPPRWRRHCRPAPSTPAPA